ncbi:predicted protein [Naegleria gruberi]|uniref:Predicted protein n=1 Tax=Naegleria gruberi TaxID=5762 RepID=D2VTC3_NAEGR|nr:uncharacterized protein NAEGRDRAFT_72249 [Naegleria gruberi]EFC39836.1 predicted protein [Naegleria gruberi]|eukprot:XP_002672580.1 predicted protein [Naegleria gruberi strain NEG-M]
MEELLKTFTNGIISKKQLKELIESSSPSSVKYFLFDVRSEQEANGIFHPILPTAVNIPIYHLEPIFEMDDEDFKSQLGIEKPKSDDLIIVYCEHGIRSAMAQQVLIEEYGYSNVINYRGSAHDWYS